MNMHSYTILEFDKLREELSSFANIDEVQNKILELNPFSDSMLVKKELDITREFMELLKYDGGIELNKGKNLTDVLGKIELVGTYLDPEEAHIVLTTLRVFRVAKVKLDEVERKYKSLTNKFKSIPTYRGLEDLISQAIDNEKNIKDEASLDLRDIRTQKVVIATNIKRKFDDIFSNPNYSNVIQEKIITKRDGRSVIPIKADFKGKLKGIEHDRSASGQTIFIEPLSIVALNNRMRELQVREREEIRKILLRITDHIRVNSSGVQQVSDAILDLDLLNAKASYSLENTCIVPEINTREYIKLVKARHPFIPKASVVPLTFELGKDYNTLLITGPNTGGKTVALKTAGLLTLMALSGIPIPAEEKTSIGYFNGIYADIGDEQSIAQNLSSFSGHLKNIKEILADITKSSLVLLDELGSGTDPSEGSAFAMAVIDYLNDKKVKSMISTHYSEVKAHAYNTDGIETASMEFDLKSLSPTYRLIIGIPGESNALAIALRLGIPEKIIARAKSYISEDDQKVEGMISKIKEKSDDLDTLQADVKKLKAEAEANKNKHEANLAKLEKEKAEIIKEAYAKADKLINDMQEKARALVDKLQKEENTKTEAKSIQKSLNMLREGIRKEKAKEKKAKPKSQNLNVFKEGEKVLVKDLNQTAIILKVNKNRETAQIQAGILKLEVSLEDLKKLVEPKKKVYVKAQAHKRTSVINEIDIRGKMVEEGVYELETYLDRALLNGYNEIYVIHGKGTGQLRAGVLEYLKTCRYVKSFVTANQNQGGLGCTVVTLK